MEIKRCSGENWILALESSCHLAHILVNADLLTVFNHIEILALIIAILTHRVESRSLADGPVPEVFAVLLNKQSLVGSRICMAVMKILAKPVCNILGDFIPDDFNSIWILIVELLLSLDWPKLIQLLGHVKQSDALRQWQSCPETRLIVMKLILKASTMLKAVQSRQIADSWAEEVLKECRLSLSAAGVKDDKGQFFKVCCRPLFELLNRLFPSLKTSFI
jgi:hypothetical protein